MATRTATAMATLVAIAACAATALANPQGAGGQAGQASLPPMARHTSGGFSFDVPKGWQVTNQQGGIMAMRDPRRRDAAILWFRPPGPSGGSTLDQMVQTALTSFGSNAVVHRNEALGNGTGKLVVVDGTLGGVAVRAGVVVWVSGQLATVGVLAAPPAEFDALGGAQLIGTVVGSARPVGGAAQPQAAPQPQAQGGSALPAGAPRGLGGPRDVAYWVDCMQDRGGDGDKGDYSHCEFMFKLHRQGKFADDRDELDPARQPLRRDAIVGSWSSGARGNSTKIVERRTETHEWFRTDGSSEGEMYVFERNGTYKFHKLTNIKLNTCATKSWETEVGRYQFDGRRMVVSPTDVSGDYSICGAAPKRQNLKQKSSMARRQYDIGIAGDGYLVFIGPTCASYDEGDRSCRPRRRWDAVPLKK
jgi:hypothetical protein